MISSPITYILMYLNFFSCYYDSSTNVQAVLEEYFKRSQDLAQQDQDLYVLCVQCFEVRTHLKLTCCIYYLVSLKIVMVEFLGLRLTSRFASIPKFVLVVDKSARHISVTTILSLSNI